MRMEQDVLRLVLDHTINIGADKMNSQIIRNIATSLASLVWHRAPSRASNAHRPPIGTRPRCALLRSSVLQSNIGRTAPCAPYPVCVTARADFAHS